MDFDEYYEAAEPEQRERAFGWATAIGLQQVDGLSPSQYLIKTAQRNIEGEITVDEARQLVDEYYETRLGQEYGSPSANAIARLHRCAKAKNDVVSSGGDVVNDVVNGLVNDGVRFSVREETAMRLLLRDSHLSAARLGEELGVKPRQAQRILAALKVKAGLKRRGSDKTGEWYFGCLKSEV